MRKTLLALAIFLLAIGTWNMPQAEAQCNERHGKSTSELGPVLRLDLAPRCFDYDLGYSALGEIGNNDYRINGTVGGVLCPCHLVKFSGEYLGQRLGYNFSSGKVHRWMHQSAIGGRYKYLVDCRWMDSIELGGTYSYAKSHRLDDVICPQISTATTVTNTTISRHIAGSHAYSFSAGTTILPWCDAWLTADLVYDHVDYNRRLHHKKIISGLGATFKLTQRIWNDFDLKLTADFRRPYNYSEVLVNWTTCTSCGLLDLGVFAGYTQGKSHLPNSSTYGVQLGYSFGPGHFQSDCCNPCNPCDCDPLLLCWLATPAVRMPQVLAISDQRINAVTTNLCNGPTSIPIPNQVVASFSSMTFNVSPFFNGNGNAITYSMVGLPVGFTINPATGVITGSNPNAFEDLVFQVTITGTTICGPTSQTFFVTIRGTGSSA